MMAVPPGILGLPTKAKMGISYKCQLGDARC